MRVFILILTSLFLLTSCSQPSKFKRYNGPEVTRIVVNKSARTMVLLHNKKVLESYRVDLGFAPRGHKFREGDGRTPEGAYRINRRNANSRYHLSLGMSYPNRADVAKARAAGVSPGGDIFIHGGPLDWKDRFKPDWTAGCISVTNKEMEQIYAMVKNGTIIQVNP